MPQRKKYEELNLENISDTEKEKSFKVQELKERRNQQRLDVYHYVVHFIAFLIIVPYILMMFLQIEVHPSYSTMVSVVIVFYFAKSLFKEN